MRLNKYQKLWIDRLKSGKTRKCQDELADGKGGNCCLGVAINVCGLEKMKPTGHRESENLDDAPKTMEALKIEADGGFDLDKLAPKWIERIEELNSSMYPALDSLILLNDETSMTHKEIGQFIDENREAVFRK